MRLDGLFFQYFCYSFNLFVETKYCCKLFYRTYFISITKQWLGEASISFKVTQGNTCRHIKHTTANKRCILRRNLSKLLLTAHFGLEQCGGPGVCMPSLKHLELFPQWGCIKACKHALTHTHAPATKQVLIHTCRLASGLKITLCSHRFSSSHYFTRENCRIQDNHEQLFAFFPGALPWQQGKTRKIIISWS